MFIVCTATNTVARKFLKVHTKMQPQLAIWSLIIGSFSISCYSCFKSLILITWEILVEYRLITCLPEAFPVFSPFSLRSSCFLRFMNSFVTVHFCLPPSKNPLPLLIALFKHSRLLCCSTLSFATQHPLLVFEQYLKKLLIV